MMSQSNAKTDFSIPTQEATYCLICFETTSPNDVARPLSCQHEFCKTCVTEYLKLKIADFKVINIPCPHSECKLKFDEKSVSRILDADAFQTFQSLVAKKIASRGPGSKFCPMPGCSKKLKISKTSPYVECACLVKICCTCCGPWHEGKTCLEVIDPEFEKYAKEQDIKFCMICKAHIQRVEGCKHITCPMCDYEWCWDCGQQYTDDHQPKCGREWSPLPPSLTFRAQIKEVWGNSSLVKRIMLVFCGLILSPVLLIGVILLWPLWIYYNPRVDLTMEKPIRSLGILLTSLSIGLILSPLVIGVGTIMLISYILFLPCTLKRCLSNDTQKDDLSISMEKRWKEGADKSFKFVAKVSPEDIIPNRANLSTDLEQGLAVETDWQAQEPWSRVSFTKVL